MEKVLSANFLSVDLNVNWSCLVVSSFPSIGSLALLNAGATEIGGVLTIDGESGGQGQGNMSIHAGT